MKEKILALFEKMSERLNNENDLSDMTWAFMSVIPSFQDLFLEYCFDEKIRILDETIREYPVPGCRPDFYFQDINKNEYLIEVKIYDTGMHFDQYKNNEQLSKCKKSFIANYYWQDEDGWKIKTWKGFLKYLESNIKEITDEDDKKLISGYMLYLKNVINYTEARAMDISNLDSIYNFYLAITEVVCNYKKVKLYEYNNSKPCTFEKYGKFVYFETGKDEYLYLWLGLYFSDTVGVYLEFEYNNKYWVPERYSKKLQNIKDGTYYEKPTTNGQYLWIKLRDEYFNKLCDKSININEQKDVIRLFLDEVIDVLTKKNNV